MGGLRIAFCEVLLQRLRRRDRSAGLDSDPAQSAIGRACT